MDRKRSAIDTVSHIMHTGIVESYQWRDPYIMHCYAYYDYVAPKTKPLGPNLLNRGSLEHYGVNPSSGGGSCTILAHAAACRGWTRSYGGYTKHGRRAALADWQANIKQPASK